MHPPRQRPNSLIYLFVLTISWQLSFSQGIKFLPLDQGRLAYARETEQKARIEKDSLLLAEAFYLYGKVYSTVGDIPVAQAYLLKSLKILEPRGPSYEVGRLYQRLSELSANKKIAREFLERALVVYTLSGSKKGLMNVKGSLAELKANQEMALHGGILSSKTYKETLREYLEVKRYYQSTRDTLGVSELSVLIGVLMSEQRKKGADFFFEEADKGYTELGLTKHQVSLQIQRARYKLNRRVLHEVVPFLEQAEKLYAQIGTKAWVYEEHIARTYMEYFEVIGDWKNAVKWQKKYLDVWLILHESEKQNAYNRLNLEYQTKLKEARLEAQSYELALKDRDLRQRNAYLLALAVLLVAALASGAGYYRLSQRYKHISTQNAQLVHEQNHRVKNNLQLVSSLLYLQASRLKNEEVRSALEESQLRIDVMAALQRKLYENEQLVAIPMPDFVTEIVDMALSAFGFRHVEVEIDVSPMLQLRTDKAMSLGLIINELVTNACKYAFPGITSPSLTISLQESAGTCTLQVADNGLGGWTPDAQPSARPSFGQRLIMIQVEQLMGTYQLETHTGTLFELHFKAPEFTTV